MAPKWLIKAKAEVLREKVVQIGSPVVWKKRDL